MVESVIMIGMAIIMFVLLILLITCLGKWTLKMDDAIDELKSISYKLDGISDKLDHL